MDTARTMLLVTASFAAGAVNSVAGGGTLISFPVLVALGLPPVVANATNTVALVPGSLASAWAYRQELAANHRKLWRYILPSVVGGMLGAALLLGARPQVFEFVVPWLVLGATLLILAKERLRRLGSASGTASPRRRRTLGILAILGMAIYGGYFGAGIGIITLAVLAIVDNLGIHEMNALKTLIASTVNGTAAVLFLWRGTPQLPTTGIMLLGMVSGGYVGAKLARRTPTKVVERLVVGIGFAMTILLALRWLR